MKTKEIRILCGVMVLVLISLMFAPISVKAEEAFTIDYSTGTITLDQVNGEVPNASFQVTADKTGVQKNVTMGNAKSTYTLQEIISNDTNGYWKQIETDNPDVFSQYADANERISGDYTIVANNGVASSSAYHVKATASGGSITFENKDAEPAQDVTYALIIDINNGINSGGLQLISEVKGGSYIEITSSLFEEYRSKITPPTGKVFGGIEVNGVQKNVGSRHLVDGNVSIKLLWVNEIKTNTTASYFISEGANQNYTIGSGQDIIVKCSGEAAVLTALKMDGQTIPTSQYTITQGSTVAKIKSAYLDSLSEGSHKLTFAYVDGESSTYVKIAKANGSSGSSSTTTTTTKTPTATITNTTNNTTSNTSNTVTTTSNKATGNTSNNPQTGDSGIAIWIGLIVISIVGIKKAIDYSKKI